MQSIDSSIEVAEMLKLFDRVFKVAIIKMYQPTIKSMLKTNEKIVSAEN